MILVLNSWRLHRLKHLRRSFKVHPVECEIDQRNGVVLGKQQVDQEEGVYEGQEEEFAREIVDGQRLKSSFERDASQWSELQA